MAEEKKESVKAEVVEEITFRKGRSNASLFWGLLLLVWGVALILDNYFALDLIRNFWPMAAVVFGSYLIYSGLKR